MSGVKSAETISRAHLCEVWVPKSNVHVLKELLEASLIHCSDSLKALFEDLQKIDGGSFIGGLLDYVAGETPDSYDLLTENYSTVRSAAVDARSWDYGKGPYFALSRPERSKFEGRFAKLSSRCQTVSLTIESINTKFPAKAGEANVPQIRASVQLNPNDEAKFDSCFAFVQELFKSMANQNPTTRVLVSS